MSKKDWRILLIGILIGIIIALGLVKIADFLAAPDLTIEEGLVPDDFSEEMGNEFDQNFESSPSSIQELDLQNP